MRVPQPKQNFWIARQWAVRRVSSRSVVAILIIFAVAGIGIARFGPFFSSATLPLEHKNSATVPQNISENHLSAIKTVPALITIAALNTGDSIEADSVKIISRPADSLPSDFLSSLDDLRGSVALGPIPANMPVSRTMLGTAVAVIPSSLDRTSATTADDLIYALARHSTAFELNFTAPTPPRGTHIAIFSVLPNGEHAIITNQAWVSSSQGTRATVLVSPDTGTIIRAFKSVQLQFELINNG